MNKSFFQIDLFGNKIEEKLKKKKKEVQEIIVEGNGKDQILIISEKKLNDDYWYIQSGNYNLTEKIKELQPKKILTFGVKALNNLIGYKASVNNINQWVGWEIPDQEYKCFIYPNYFLDTDNEIINNRYNKYLDYAINTNKKFKIYDPIVKICNESTVSLFLEKIKDNEIISIDIETSGLKPHKKGHFIYSIAITQSSLFTFSFLLTEKIIPQIKKLLENENIKKIIQNCQFEYSWFKEILNIDIKGIVFDTQLAAHILDNRANITGLKFQTYVNFGVIGYENEIKKYITTDEKGGNEFNKIKEVPVRDILIYNGYDSYFTMLLYQKQKRLLDKHLQKGFNFFLEGNLELCRISGIKFDKEKYEKNKLDLIEKIDDLHNKIINSREMKLVEDKDFNYNSDKQLRELLFDKCKWKTKNKTSSGKYSVDEEALKKFDKKFTNNILERRKLTKTRDTYLEQFIREAVEINNEYFIFPFFSLNNVSSYRSGSQAPNFQNIPVRNELAKKLTRGCLIPRKNRKLLEIDFKQMEVSTSCCYHFDPIMIDYVTKNGDMHKDLAKQLFFKTDKTFSKKERQIAKGNFVFAEFYGDTARIYNEQLQKQGYGKVTAGLWEQIENDFDILENLKLNGINNIYDFQKHVENIEKDFWGNRFLVYQQWKFDNWRKYKELGYIELYTGFRCNSVLGFNQVNNIQIQGTAFHIALKTFIELNKYLRKEKFDSVILGEIHDSIILDINPLELPFIIRILNNILEKIRNEWEWIIVPLKIDYEITDLNGSWDTKKELKNEFYQ